MASLTIPEGHYDALATILGLSDESINELIAALEQVSPKLYPSDLIVEMIPKVRTISSEQLEDIIDALHTLYLTRLHHDVTPEQLANDVCEALDELDDAIIRLTSENRDTLENRLKRLLSIDALVILAKAFSVLRSQENMYCRARIITDIRPVFGADPEVAPKAAVLVHVLNITYHYEGEVKEFYVALDTKDVGSLQRVLERANIKTTSLRRMLAESKLTYLDAE